MKKKNNKNQKKTGRFGKLYIAAAVCTAGICVLVLGITTKISNSVLKASERTALVNIPTQSPIDSLIKEQIALPTVAPLIVPEPEPLPTKEPDNTELPIKSEPQAEKTVEAGLFKKDERIKLSLPTAGEILNECSLDKLKKSKTLNDWRTHNGVDIKADTLTPVNAAASGEVSESRYDNQMGYIVKIKHGGGYETLYSNLASNEMAEAGQIINVGECLGAVGDSAVFEKLEDSHLHFELTKDGKYVNPMEYME